MNKIITIGREFGSGGREVGRKLAEALGYDYYDKEIITEIARNTSLSENYVRQIVECHPHDLFPITVAHTFSYIDSYTLRQKQNVYLEQEKVLKKMAETSNCVIVGRCADYILKAYNPVRIFVFADSESKIDRCIARNEKAEQLTRKKVLKYIKNIDKSRARYYEFYTGHPWGDKLNYDICLNTTGIEIDEIIPHLAAMVK